MKRYIIESLGTFFLTLAVAFSANPLAIGLIFMAMVIITHGISSGYFNPAVVVTGFMRGSISARDSIWYIFAQCLGAAAALAWFFFCYGDLFLTPLPCPSIGMSAVFELLLTSLFIVMIFVASRTATQQWIAPYVGVTAGLTLSGAGFMGGFCNPAIAGMSIVVALFQGYSDGISDILIAHVLCALCAGIVAHFALNYLNPKAA